MGGKTWILGGCLFPISLGNPRFEFFPSSKAGGAGGFNWNLSPPVCWWQPDPGGADPLESWLCLAEG